MAPCVDIRSYTRQEIPHRHDFHQMVLPFRGTMLLDADLSGRVQASTAAFIRAGEQHSFSVTEQGKFIVLDLPTHERKIQPDRIPSFFHVDPVLRSLLDYVSATSAQGMEPGSAWMSLLIDQMDRVSAAADAQDAILERAQAYMHRHLAAPITVADIARNAGTSVSGLKRLMHDRRATTPAAILTTLRIEEAEQLLTETSVPLAEIAAMTGYADQSALNRAFRRERGTTPGAVRRKARGEN